LGRTCTNLVSIKDADLNTNSYDQLNRLTQKLYPDSTTVHDNYDNGLRLTQIVDPTG